MMQQYLDIKAQNPDSILFFRLGDFYEMFNEDAKLVSRELDLTLTTRDRNKPPEQRTPMCGVPYHSCDSYIARLIAKGYKVAICEQTEDPSQAKGLVSRDIIRVVTPGTVDASMLEGSRAQILALLDGPVRRACGGAGRLVLSSLVEILLSALVAPVAMVIQSGSVMGILLGRDTGWNPQRRDDGSIPLRDIVVRHRWHTLLGLVAGVAAFAIATSLFLWMSPTILGLVLAIPISWASGQLGLGLALKRRLLLATPE